MPNLGLTEEFDNFPPQVHVDPGSGPESVSVAPVAEHEHSFGDEIGFRELTARLGVLPEDFDLPSYLVLNPDINSAPGAELWAVQHFLSHGKSEGRSYTRAARARWEARLSHDLREPPRPTLVHRSSVADRRRTLQAAFGAQATDDAFVRAVITVSGAIRMKPSPAAPLLEDVILGRYLLSAQGAYGRDFESPRTQLDALFFSLAGCPNIPRLAVELTVANRVGKAAVEMEIAPSKNGWPPLTLFMMAARAALRGVDPADDLMRPELAVAKFFVRDVRELQLQPWVTAAQRANLRQPTAEGRSVVQSLLEASQSPSQTRHSDSKFETQDLGKFWTQDVWLLGLDYLMSGAQVAASQVAVETLENGDLRVRAPDFLFHTQGEDSDPLHPEAAHEWLTRFVDVERGALGFPTAIVAPSSLAYVRRRYSPRSVPVVSPDMSAPQGAAVVRPGDTISFGQGGNGEGFKVGAGWHPAESTHTWSSDAHAQIAFRLDVPQGAALDLFLDMGVFDPVGETRVTVVWNGKAVSEHALGRKTSTWTESHLGIGRRPLSEVNTLILSSSHVRSPASFGQSDERSLAVNLGRLIVAAR